MLAWLLQSIERLPKEGYYISTRTYVNDVNKTYF
jgi:hypothetical protein